MNGKRLRFTARILAVLLLASSIGALAQAPLPEHVSGILSDYTSVVSNAGPWEIRGHWALDLKGRSGKAEFSAYMTMELSDYGVSRVGKDAGVAANRGAHTHHILMTDATVSSDPADTSSCPTFSPTNTALFVVSGTANFISGNGNAASFEKNGASMLQVCVSGGTDGASEVQYSNMTLVFAGPATGHFGTDPIHGVVRFPHNLHQPTGLSKAPLPDRSLLWTAPDNATAQDAVTYNLSLTGGSGYCASGCLIHPGAPSWYTLGPSLGSGNFAWTLQAVSATRPYGAPVAGPPFSLP